MEIIELTLLTNDLDATETFYNELLGLPVSDKSPNSVAFLTGHSKLSFKLTDISKPFYHFAFNIPHNKLDDALHWAKSKVNVLDIENNNPIADFSNWNAQSFYFLDNNNNIVEFIARFDLNNVSPNPFDGSSILSISEVGIPSTDVLNESKQIVDGFGLPYFTKQNPSETFVVVGNDEGILIFVKNERNWYPTTLPSQRHWSRIKLKNQDKQFEIEIEP